MGLAFLQIAEADGTIVTECNGKCWGKRAAKSTDCICGGLLNRKGFSGAARVVYLHKEALIKNARAYADRKHGKNCTILIQLPLFVFSDLSGEKDMLSIFGEGEGETET